MGIVRYITKPKECPYDTKENFAICEECPAFLCPRVRIPPCERKVV